MGQGRIYSVTVVFVTGAILLAAAFGIRHVVAGESGPKRMVVSDRSLVLDPSPSDLVPPGRVQAILEDVAASGREQTIKYGPDPESHVADVYRPDPATVPASGSPTLVFFHGGGWLLGDRSQIRSGSTTASIVAMIEYGWTIISAEYRLSENGKTPAQIQDVRRLIKFLKHDASSLGINRNQIVVAGHSAGAQLALLAATSCRVDRNKVSCSDRYEPTGPEGWLQSENARPAGVVALASVTDVVAVTDPEVYPDLSFAARAMLGCATVEPTCFDEAEKLNPAFWLDSTDPPIFMAHGTVDDIAPFADHAAPFATKADSILGPSDRFRIDVVDDAGHDDLRKVNAAELHDFLVKAVESATSSSSNDSVDGPQS